MSNVPAGPIGPVWMPWRVGIDVDQALIERIVLGILRHELIAAVVGNHDVIVGVFPHHMRSGRIVHGVIDRVQRQRVIILPGIEIDIIDKLTARCQELLDSLVCTGPDAGVEAVIEACGGVGVDRYPEERCEQGRLLAGRPAFDR